MGPHDQNKFLSNFPSLRNVQLGNVVAYWIHENPKQNFLVFQNNEEWAWAPTVRSTTSYTI